MPPARQLAIRVAHVDGEAFQSFEVRATVPAAATSTDISIVLSKTSVLEVDDLQLVSLSAVNSFDFLIDAMKAKYSYFKLKNVDPDALADRYREKADEAKTNDEFAEVVADMLAELQDIHTWVIKDGQRFGKYFSSHTPNYNFDFIESQLKYSKAIGNYALLGLTKQGIGYVRITALPVLSKADLAGLQKTIRKLFQAKGMIVDLRRNSGGAEPTAQAIAGLFSDKEFAYAKQRLRRHDGAWAEPQTRILHPVAGRTYMKPIVCLIGPGAVSSAEGFAMMMKALDHCHTIGLATRGASGNPAPVTLPNGVEVWFSRWIAMEMDGTPIEDRGVMPDNKIRHPSRSKGDPTFEQAVKLLIK